MITQIKKGISRMTKIGLVAALVLGQTGVVGAQQAQEEEEIIIAPKVVSGEVAAISSRLITIIYDKDEEKKIEHEIDLPIDKDIKLVHKRELSDINIGDIVRVTYEESQKEEEIEKEGITETITKVIGRQAKVITFVRPKREY